MHPDHALAAFALAAAALVAAPALAQPVPEAAEIPETVTRDLTDFGEGQGYAFLDLVRGWQTDLDGDGAEDLLVQAAWSAGGGNAVVLHHFPYYRQGEEFRRGEDMALDAGIKSVTWEDGTLVLTLYQMLPDDPNCCPSGERVLRLTF